MGVPMLDADTLAQINGKYVNPPGAGPAWLAATEYGFDMSLIEDALKLTPQQRLEQHQRALNLVLDLKRAGERNAAK